MTDYLIFHYCVDEQPYVEAYPVHDDLPVSFSWAQAQFGDNAQDIAWVSSPSRNQARRAAYTNWIQADGKGFNQLPYRAYAEER